MIHCNYKDNKELYNLHVEAIKLHTTLLSSSKDSFFYYKVKKEYDEKVKQIDEFIVKQKSAEILHAK